MNFYTYLLASAVCDSCYNNRKKYQSEKKTIKQLAQATNLRQQETTPTKIFSTALTNNTPTLIVCIMHLFHHLNILKHN